MFNLTQHFHILYVQQIKDLKGRLTPNSKGRNIGCRDLCLLSNITELGACLICLVLLKEVTKYIKKK